MRKKLGTKALITLYDSRWTNIARGMIASIEVDMSNNSGIFYCSTDFLTTIKDFIQHIHIGIETKGYEEVQVGDNLLISIAFIVRCTMTSKIKYKVYVEVVQILSSKGIKMIKPLKCGSEQLVGLEWNLDKFIEPTQVIVPQDSLIYTDMQGRISIRFTDYTTHTTKELEESSEADRTNIEIDTAEI